MVVVVQNLLPYKHVLALLNPDQNSTIESFSKQNLKVAAFTKIFCEKKSALETKIVGEIIFKIFSLKKFRNDFWRKTFKTFGRTTANNF